MWRSDLKSQVSVDGTGSVEVYDMRWVWVKTSSEALKLGAWDSCPKNGTGARTGRFAKRRNWRG